MKYKYFVYCVGERENGIIVDTLADAEELVLSLIEEEVFYEYTYVTQEYEKNIDFFEMHKENKSFSSHKLKSLTAYLYDLYGNMYKIEKLSYLGG